MYSSVTNHAHRNRGGSTTSPTNSTQNNVNSNSASSVQIQLSPSTANGHTSPDYETHLRAKLRFFFMSPCWKWHLKRQFPWKAWFQFIKIIIVTTQV